MSVVRNIKEDNNTFSLVAYNSDGEINLKRYLKKKIKSVIYNTQE